MKSTGAVASIPRMLTGLLPLGMTMHKLLQIRFSVRSKLRVQSGDFDANS